MFCFPTQKINQGSHTFKKLHFIFGKKGKPLDSVAATLKTSPEMDWFGNLEAYIKIRKKLSGLLKTIASHKSKQIVTLNH